MDFRNDLSGGDACRIPHMLPPHFALFPPLTQLCDRPQISLGHRILARSHRQQMQNLLLNIWGQMQQIHDLRDAGLRYVRQTGEFR